MRSTQVRNAAVLRIGRREYVKVERALLATLGLELVDGGHSYTDGRRIYLGYSDAHEVLGRYAQLGLAVPRLAIDEPPGSTPAASLDCMRPVTVFAPPAEESEEASEEAPPATDDGANDHVPDVEEGEWEGACNECGGSHCSCARCGVSFCIICEVHGCTAR